MLRRLVLLCATGCAPTTLAPASPVEPASPPSALAPTNADAERVEPDLEGSTSDPPPPTAAASAPPPGDAPLVEGGSDNATPSEPIDEPTPTPIVITGAQVPGFARLRFEPRTLGKQRITIRRVGTLYAPSSLVPLTDDGSGDGILTEVRVIDGDAAGNPRRPRVLCDNGWSRLGVALDAEDLATTVRTNAFVSARPAPPQRRTSKTPGLRLAGGTEVQVLPEPVVDGATAIAYRGLFLVAEGFVPPTAVDVVYTPGKLEDDGRRNGKLLRNVRFLDAPHGMEIARTEQAAGVANTMDVLRLGPVEDDHMLVRYQENDAFVVGWVRSEDVERYEMERLGWGEMTGRGSGTASDHVELARGTRLVPTGSEEVIGVITEDHDVPCVADCERPNPHVRVRACSRTLTLRAVP